MSNFKKDQITLKLVSFIVAFLVLSACGKPEQVKQIGSYGLAENFTLLEARALGGLPGIEISFVKYQNKIKALAPATNDLHRIFLSNLDGSDSIEVLPDARFAYAVQHQDTYYVFAQRGRDIYVYESTNLVDWDMQETPVIEASNNPESVLYTLWNVGATVDASGTWHMLIESASAAGSLNQTGVGLAYATGSIVNGELLFTASDEHVIPHGGNPDLKFVEGKGVLAFHGQANDPHNGMGNEWYTTVSTFVDDTWTTHKDFIIGTKGVHVCDPHAIETDNGILLGVSFDQLYLYTMTSAQTFEELFDSLTQSFEE